jgi:dihydrofolate reductase
MGNAAVELVVAVSENDVIGRGNQLPWRLPADLQHFRALTLGHHILMGRKTHESIGRALPGRTNWILSRSRDFAAADCNVVPTLQEALSGVAGGAPLMVIGGAEIYRLCLPRAQRIHLTLVHSAITGGDTFFDAWRRSEWSEVSRERHEADAKNAYPYSFLILDRKLSAAAP